MLKITFSSLCGGSFWRWFTWFTSLSLLIFLRKSGNWSIDLKRKVFQTISDIIFGTFCEFSKIKFSPQVVCRFKTLNIPLIYEWPHEWPNDLRLRILGNKEISKKHLLMWNYKPRFQAPEIYPKLVSFRQTLPKKRLSTFWTKLYLPPNWRLSHYIFSLIVWKNKFLLKNSFQTPLKRTIAIFLSSFKTF